jgi:hypothetical protein
VEEFGVGDFTGAFMVGERVGTSDRHGPTRKIRDRKSGCPEELGPIRLQICKRGCSSTARALLLFISRATIGTLLSRNRIEDSEVA